MVVNRFRNQFGLMTTIEDEKSVFVSRINQDLISYFDKVYNKEKLFLFVCYSLGVNGKDRIKDANSQNYYSVYDTVVPSFRTLTNDDFTKTLELICVLYQYYSGSNGSGDEASNIEGSVKLALDLSRIDLGVRWRKGMFYPKNAKLFDEKLVDDSIDWLSEFQEEKIDYEKAVTSLISKDYGNVIGSCYLALEGLSRKLLKNKKVLENNKEDLLKKISISDEWKTVLSKYIEYSNNHKRHASEDRHDIKPEEAEFFLYLTGIFIRLLITSSK